MSASDEKSRNEKSLREQQLEERKQHMASLRRTVPTVKVTPKDDTIRKYLTHAPTGLKFPDSGPAEWPNDTFTQRRIRDGDITVASEHGSDHSRSRSRSHAE